MRRRRAEGGDLYFHRPRPLVLELWRRIGYTTEIDSDHIFATKRIAITKIFDRLDRGTCAQCRVRVFQQCASRPAAPDAS